MRASSRLTPTAPAPSTAAAASTAVTAAVVTATGVDRTEVAELLDGFRVEELVERHCITAFAGIIAFAGITVP